MLKFYDYCPTADLSGKIQKSLQWDSLQHRRALADLCMFCGLRNNLAITPMLVPSMRHNCHCNHIQSLHSYDFITNFLEVSDFGTSFLAIWQLSRPLIHFVLQPSSGSHSYCSTSNQAQIPGAWFNLLLICLFCFVALTCLLQCCNWFLLYLSNAYLHNYWHFFVIVFMAFLE